MRRRAAVLLLAAGCGAPAPRAADSVPPAAPEPRTVTADSLRLTLHLPAAAAPGAPVPITLRVENATDRSLDLYLRGRTIAFDILVTRAAGDTVWRRLAGEVIPAIVQVKTLAPGERLELRATWDQRQTGGRPAGAGDYLVRGALLTEAAEPLATAPVELRIG